MKSKVIYDLFLKNYTVALKLGGEGRYREVKIFEKLNKNIKNSQIKTINYKIILNGLGLNKIFKNRYGRICYLCKKEIDEDMEHIYINSDSVKPCLRYIENKMENKQKLNNIDCING